MCLIGALLLIRLITVATYAVEQVIISSFLFLEACVSVLFKLIFFQKNLRKKSRKFLIKIGKSRVRADLSSFLAMLQCCNVAMLHVPCS